MNKIFLFLFFLISNCINCYANCSNMLRLEIKKKLGEAHFLFSSDFSNLITERSIEMQQELSNYGSDVKMIEKKTGLPTRQFKELIVSDAFEPHIKNLLITLFENVHNKDLVLEWAESLYKDAIVEMYLEKDATDIRRFEINGEINEELLISSLLQRSIEGGFRGKKEDIAILDDELLDKDFSQLMLDKKYIYDLGFISDNHGHLIHLFNLDFIIYSFKKNGIDPLNASTVYTWFGKQQFYTETVAFRFRPLDAWFVLFDSFENDFTSPERLNPILSNYFQHVKRDKRVY